MLFADVVGYSKLPESAYLPFTRKFLTEAAAILQQKQIAAVESNTWGDAIFAVFEKAAHAAEAAIQLQRMTQGGDWIRRLFGKTDHEGRAIQLRIGLHAGPVQEGNDAITRRKSYVGRHTNLAARLEPIAEEGQIYVTGEFAAIATLDSMRSSKAKTKRFQFDYVGQRILPKGAGMIPVYRLMEKS